MPRPDLDMSVSARCQTVGRSLLPGRPTPAALNEREDERGAVMVEMAVISVVLVLLLFGIIEGGLAFRAKLGLSNSADEAARRGAVAANDPFADWQVLQQILIHSSDGGSSIERVVVFKADSDGSGPPVACIDASSSSHQCNSYGPEDLLRPRSDFGSCGGLDGSWCPNDRSRRLADLDLLGVWVRGRFDSPSGALGTISMVELSIQPLESAGQ